MKSKKTNHLSSASVLMLALCSLLLNQGRAQADATQAGLQQFMTNDFNPTARALTQQSFDVELQIEQALQTDEVTQNDSSTENNKPQTWKKKYDRWLKRLNEKLVPRAISNFSKKVDQLSDSETLNEVAQINQKAKQNGDEAVLNVLSADRPINELKTAIKTNFEARIHHVTPYFANQIATAGGIVPFLIHLKSQLRNLREKVGSHHSSSNRKIASVMNCDGNDLETVLFLTGIALVLVGMGGMLAVGFSTAFFFIGIGGLFMAVVGCPNHGYTFMVL